MYVFPAAVTAWILLGLGGGQYYATPLDGRSFSQAHRLLRPSGPYGQTFGLIGTVLMLEVGATCVGSFAYTFPPQTRVAKGAEKGYFRFGGSSTITLFEPGRVKLDDDLVAHSAARRELYARMGDRLGVAV